MASNTIDLIFLTDCHSFENGHCARIRDCPYRHSPTANRQRNACVNWPEKCRSVNCPFKHPGTSSASATTPKAIVRIASPPKSLISFFWDIENVPIPKNQNAFDIVQRIRQKLVVEPGLREDTFSCYCDIKTIPQDKQLSLHMANVRMIHVPDRKPNAVDRQILLDLDRFERVHRPPATVVLISGDIDFVGKLSDLRHQAAFRVIAIHSKSVKEELKNTVNQCFLWDQFTNAELFAALVEKEKEKEKIETATRPNSDEIQQRSRARRSRSRKRTDRSKSRPKIMSVVPRVAQPIVPISAVPTIVPQEAVVCPKCPCRFGTMAALRQHQTAKNHFFQCPICDDSFQTLASLNQHQNIKNHHFTDFRCGQCKKTFSKIESLNQHQQAMGHQTTTKSTVSAETMKIILDAIPPIKRFYLGEK